MRKFSKLFDQRKRKVYGLMINLKIQQNND